MFYGTVDGIVQCDLELKQATKKYVGFMLAVSKGVGAYQRTFYARCWCFDDVAESMVRKKVRQGSHIVVACEIELAPVMQKDHRTDHELKIVCYDWRFFHEGPNPSKPWVSDSMHNFKAAASQSTGDCSQ